MKVPKVQQSLDQQSLNKLWVERCRFLTDDRIKKLESAAKRRTDLVRLVIQDVHEPHNISACLRSADAFGLTTVHVITLKEKFRISSVARGSSQWLKVRRHSSVEDCVSELKREGFKIAAGVPTPNAHPISSLPVTEPLAVIFGNEHSGLSAEWRHHADWFFTIPMDGMVESLNISVCAAITLYDLTQRSKKLHTEERYFINPIEARNLLCYWTR